MEYVLAELAKGTPLAKICATNEPCAASTFLGWCDADPGLSERYARARESGFDALAVDALDISDGKEGKSTGDVKRDRLAVETRLKLLAVWDRKRYGTRPSDAAAGGADESAPPLDETAVAARLAAILELGRRRANGEPV